MPVKRYLTLVAVAFLTLQTVCSPASAASLTNRDATEHTLEIISGGQGGSKILKPEEALNDICPKGCVVRLDADQLTTYELQASDIVSIEDGFIYYDRDDSVSSSGAR